jgi:DNA-binding NarL/FixJ family response regulator
MPEMNGLEAAKAIRIASPNTEILIVSMHQTDQLIREIVDSGVRGYILKSDSERDLILAVENLANHKHFFAPEVTELILGRFSSGGASVEPPAAITERITPIEREIIKLVAEGKGSKDVALAFGISDKTAETYRLNIMRKLDVHTVTELVRYALRNRIVEE